MHVSVTGNDQSQEIPITWILSHATLKLKTTKKWLIYWPGNLPENIVTFSSGVHAESMHYMSCFTGGIFSPQRVLSAECGNGKKLWLVTYLPRVIWRLKNIYDVIKNYFENGNFLPWFLDYLALLSALCTTWACYGCTRWLTRAPYPLRDEYRESILFCL